MDDILCPQNICSGHRTVGEEKECNNHRLAKRGTLTKVETWKTISQKINIFDIWERIDES